MAPGFEVWQSPGGKIWSGIDQEEAFLAGLGARQPGVLTEVAEIFTLDGDVRPRRLAVFDDRQKSEAST